MKKIILILGIVTMFCLIGEKAKPEVQQEKPKIVWGCTMNNYICHYCGYVGSCYNCASYHIWGACTAYCLQCQTLLWKNDWHVVACGCGSN